MTTPNARPAFGLAVVLRIAALVIFILAAIFGIAGSVDDTTVLWLTNVGLASWVGSSLVP